jgi:hypothetical protein
VAPVEGAAQPKPIEPRPSALPLDDVTCIVPTMSASAQQRICVSLPAELRSYVERQATAEDRSQASYVRRLIQAEAERREHSRGRAA